jgi:hypothetical protein
MDNAQEITVGSHWRGFRQSVRNLWRNRVPIKHLAVGTYEQYRATQIAGNYRKLDMVFAIEANIAHLVNYASDRLRLPEVSILCHGSRNGAEVGWFRRYSPSARVVLGTDISDTATKFPGLIQWDFHDLKEEWVDAWDVIYSNSWDHAFDPVKMFRNWMRCLSHNGLLFIEHSTYRTPARVSRLDPLGAKLDALCRMLDRIGGSTGNSVRDIIRDLPDRADHRCVVVVGR